MTDLNSSLLNDKFNYYFERAKQEEKKGNIRLAKRNYLLASETLLRLAKTSGEALQKTRISKAKKIAEMAEQLSENEQTQTKKTQSKATTSQETEKKWKEAVVPDISFDDVVGLEKVKKSIFLRMINPIKYPEKYKIYKKKTGGGVLLYGPPGTGKTMIAKAIANEVGAKFYVVKGSDIVSKWVGESEKNISALFETASKEERAIIFIDEMDSLIAKRGGQDTHNDKRVNEFLQQMDGFASKKDGLLLLGATNRPWDIDPAALRSGRFSEKIYVPLPDNKAREFMFGKFLSDLPLEKDVSIKELVDKTQLYSGADLEELCDRAKEEPLLKAIKTDAVVNISQKDLLKALKQVKPYLDKEELLKFVDFAKKF